MSQVYALNHGSARDKIIHDCHDSNKGDDESPCLPCFRPFQVGLAIIEKGNDKTCKDNPQIRRLHNADTEGQEQNDLCTRVQPVDRRVPIDIRKINKHSALLEQCGVGSYECRLPTHITHIRLLFDYPRPIRLAAAL